MRRWAVWVLLGVYAPALSACSGGGVSVAADPSDLIRGVGFIDSEDLPVPVSPQEVYDHVGFEGAVVLPGSEPRRLLIAMFGNCCAPVVSVAAPEVAGPPQLNVAAWQSTGPTCCDALVMWPFEVTLNRDVDPAEVVLEVIRQPSVPEARPSGPSDLSHLALGTLLHAGPGERNRP